MQFVIALVAEPHQTVFQGVPLRFRSMTRPSDPLAHRAVRHARRVQVHVARAELHVDRLAVLLDANGDLAFKLVEQLLRLVVMVVLPRIGAGHNHHDVIAAVHVEVLFPTGGLRGRGSLRSTTSS